MLWNGIAGPSGPRSTARKPSAPSSRSSTGTCANGTFPRRPRLRLEIRDRLDHVVQVRDEREWPLARTDWRRLRLGEGGALSDAEGGAGSVTSDLRREAAVFDHRFDEDTELSGPMTLRLRVAATGAEDPRLFAGIEKWSHGAPVPFEGSYGYGRDLVAQGRLRLALRELDPVLSTPHQPEHTFRTLQPVRDGEEADVLIALSSSATLFRAGDELRLTVAGRYQRPRNPFFGHFPTHYQPTTSGKATILWSPGNASTLEIPVIPKT
ncbi:CocE/NonD family hydrolase [Streptomyces griseofuscus]|uniref:CocE/NonD family hydrolase n=1 Tax=Streptomyces griseofuscus TaxID=146922 RepID=UPI00369E251A